MTINQMEGLHKPSGSVDLSQSALDLRGSRAVHNEDNDSDLLVSTADLFDGPGSSDGVSVRSILSAYSDDFHGSQELRDVDAEIRHQMSQLTKAIAESIQDRDDEITYGVSISEGLMHSFRTAAEDRNGQLKALAENLTDLEKERRDLLKAIGKRNRREDNSTTATDELIEFRGSSSSEDSHVRPKNRIRTTREANLPSDTGPLPKQLSSLRRIANIALISAAVIVPIPVMVLATAWAPGLDLGGILAVISGLVLGVDAFMERASLRHVLAVMVFAQFQAIDMGIKFLAERLTN